MIEVEARGEGAYTRPLVDRIVWTCGRLGLERASVGLMVVGPDEMAEINGEHRGKPEPTDVLDSTLAFLMALLVAQSRVEAGIHSVVETLAGAVLGTCVAIVIFQVWG